MFCETTTGKRSGEHLLRQWFEGRIEWPGEGIVRRKVEPGRDDVFTTMPVSPFKVPINDVCRDCNAGWMNDMEGRVGDLIVELANRERSTIPKELARPLAAWCFKTALLRTCMDSSREGWRAERSWFQALYNSCDSPECPEGVRVQVGRCEQPVLPIGRNTQVALLPVRQRHKRVAELGKVRLVTFTVGIFFFQVSFADTLFARRLMTRGLKNGRITFSHRISLLWPYEHPGDLNLHSLLLQEVEGRLAGALLYPIVGQKEEPPLTAILPD